LLDFSWLSLACTTFVSAVFAMHAGILFWNCPTTPAQKSKSGPLLEFYGVMEEMDQSKPVKVP